MARLSSLFLFAFIMLTRPDGLPIWVSTEHIASVTGTLKAEADVGGNADIGLDSGKNVFVREYPGSVIDHARHD